MSDLSTCVHAGTVGPRLRYLAHLGESGRIDPAPERIALALVVEPARDPLGARCHP